MQIPSGARIFFPSFHLVFHAFLSRCISKISHFGKQLSTAGIFECSYLLLVERGLFSLQYLSSLTIAANHFNDLINTIFCYLAIGISVVKVLVQLRIICPCYLALIMIMLIVLGSY